MLQVTDQEEGKTSSENGAHLTGLSQSDSGFLQVLNLWPLKVLFQQDGEQALEEHLKARVEALDVQSQYFLTCLT